MSKNLIPDVAHMLGVEIGEEFLIKDNYGQCVLAKYKFSNENLLVNVGNKEENWRECGWFEKLITGEACIEKLPYKPKVGEYYWTFTACLDCNGKCTSQWAPLQDAWYGCIDDYMRLKLGLIYRTEAEAEAALPAKYEEVTGKEYCEE